MIFELKRILFKDDFSVLLIELNTQAECLTKIDIDDLIYQLFDKTIPRIGYRRSYRDLVCSNVYHLENGNLAVHYSIPDSFYDGIAKDVEEAMTGYFEALNNNNLVSKEETAKYMEKVMTRYFEAQVLNNNDSVSKDSKEETNMKTTTMNNDVVVIEFSVAEQLKNRLNIKGTHSDGYLGKAEIGEILGFSKKKVNSSKREELIDALTKAIDKAYRAQIDKQGKEIDYAKTGTIKEKETKDKSPQEKLNAFLEELHNVALKNKEKGYGTTITSFMFDALILKHQYGIDNLKAALKDDAIIRETGMGDIIVTEEKIDKIKEVKKWLINKGLIKAAIYTSDTHKNYYLEDVYDGNYAKSMTKLTEEIYSLLHDVKTVSYRVY